jgi:hypothetical protein
MLEANLTSNSKSSSDDEPSLFERAIVAEDLWRDHLEHVWAQKIAGTPEYKRADIESSVLSDAYQVLFREFCDFALANPSLETLGQVVVLWRLRCWDSDQMPACMEDNFEARTIARLSEILTGIKH